MLNPKVFIVTIIIIYTFLKCILSRTKAGVMSCTCIFQLAHCLLFRGGTDGSTSDLTLLLLVHSTAPYLPHRCLVYRNCAPHSPDPCSRMTSS